MFQSSPGPKAGRCRGAARPSSADRPRFNPRPARRPGAANARLWMALVDVAFQSSPGPKAGRCLWVVDRWSASIEFQSSPGPKAGRCSGAPRSPTAGSGFNPRPARRPGAASLPSPASSGTAMFQSSPGPKAGRCLVTRDVDGSGRQVSILARPEGRALHQPRPRQAGVDDVSILARPEGRALHSPSLLPTSSPKLFQSSPGPKAGRCPVATSNLEFKPRSFTITHTLRGCRVDCSGLLTFTLLVESCLDSATDVHE